MKRLLFITTLLLVVNNLTAQVINLKQQKAKDDIQVLCYDYEFYFKKADIITAIREIDQKLSTDHANLVNDKLKVVDLRGPSEDVIDFAHYFKKGLGTYLLQHGKGAIYRGGKQIVKIAQEMGPVTEDLDGNREVIIRFAEENLETPLFIGDINMKLLH